MIVKIYIGDNQIELQKDESISITSSVLDIQDITKNTTDYSRSFTVPASEANNKTFKHYYDANIDNTFDARIKVEGRIEIDGIVFRIGKFLLQKVNVKQGKPSSYTINFWGNLISIKDLLGNKELSELDFTALDHDYNSTIVHDGLMNGLFDGKIIYNLLVKKQLYYNTLVTDTTQTDKLANIAYNTISGSNGVRYSELRPSIKLLSIIEAIEVDNDVIFSRDFFGRSEFTNLYLWLNSESGNKIGGGTKVINWDSGDADNINLLTNIGTFLTDGLSGTSIEKYWEISLHVIPETDFITIPYTIRFYKDGILSGQKTITPVGGVLTEGILSVVLESETEQSNSYELYWEVSSDYDFEFTANVTQSETTNDPFPPYESFIVNFTTYASVDTISSVGGISKNMPKIKTLDFLKGIFQMFKLVVIPQMDGTIYVNTLKDFYEIGNIYNITSYIDFENYDVERGNILNEISYKFKEPTTILNKQFKVNNGKGYGDEIAILKDDFGVKLDGESLTIDVPFEQFIYERLLDTDDGTTTNIMYGAIVDDKVDPTNPAPHIFYNIIETIGAKSFAFLLENDVKLEYDGQINMPSHINTLINQNFSTTFSQEFNEWDGGLIQNTLYSNYHNDYIDAIFNIKRRDFTFTAKNLPISILSKLDLNDVLIIKDNYYRIDKFTADIINEKTEFNLINSFDYVINGFSSSDTNIQLTKDAQSYYVFVTNLTDYIVTKIDTGYGIGWITITDDGTNLIFTVTANSITVRNIIVRITDVATSQIIDFSIKQMI